VPELKPDHHAVLKVLQSHKQIADLFLQLEIIDGGLPSTAFGAKSRDPHDLHLRIENWLAGTNKHILDPAELVFVHQLYN
jgi:hypothetical protein